MSIVQNELPGARVLDLFAGTGALGLEALSRGAAHADFVESDPRSLESLRGNVASLGAVARLAIHRADAFSYVTRLSRETYSLTFADPPYHLGLASRLASVWLASPFSMILGVEHEATESLPEGGDLRRYGDTAVTFFRS